MISLPKIKTTHGLEQIFLVILLLVTFPLFLLVASTLHTLQNCQPQTLRHDCPSFRFRFFFSVLLVIVIEARGIMALRCQNPAPANFCRYSNRNILKFFNRAVKFALQVYTRQESADCSRRVDDHQLAHQNKKKSISLLVCSQHHLRLVHPHHFGAGLRQNRLMVPSIGAFCD